MLVAAVAGRRRWRYIDADAADVVLLTIDGARLDQYAGEFALLVQDVVRPFDLDARQLEIALHSAADADADDQGQGAKTARMAQAPR